MSLIKLFCWHVGNGNSWQDRGLSPVAQARPILQYHSKPLGSLTSWSHMVHPKGVFVKFHKVFHIR